MCGHHESWYEWVALLSEHSAKAVDHPGLHGSSASHTAHSAGGGEGGEAVGAARTQRGQLDAAQPWWHGPTPPAKAFLRDELGHAIREALGVAWASLDLDLRARGWGGVGH